MADYILDKKVAKALQNKLKEDVQNNVYDSIIPTEELKQNIISNSKRVINHVLNCDDLKNTIDEAIEDAILLYIYNRKNTRSKK